MSDIEKRMRVTARIMVTVEVQIEQPWDAHASLAFIHERASADAIARLRRALNLEPIRILGDAKVLVVTSECP